MPPRKVKEPVDPSTLRRSGRTKATEIPATVDADEEDSEPVAKKSKVEKKNGTKSKKLAESGGSPKNEAAPLPTPALTDAEDKTPSEPKEEGDSVLEVGDELPDVTIADQDGNDVSIKSIAAEKTVVIFAYPKASTPGCTRQACGYRDEFPKFEKSDVAVFGLSADSVELQKKFQEKQKLPYSLLADTSYKLIGPLGAKKTPKGGITRSYWIIKDGKIATKVIGVKPEDSVKKSVEAVTA